MLPGLVGILILIGQIKALAVNCTDRLASVITGPPNGPVFFALAVVCRRRLSSSVTRVGVGRRRS